MKEKRNHELRSGNRHRMIATTRTHHSRLDLTRPLSRAVLGRVLLASPQQPDPVSSRKLYGHTHYPYHLPQCLQLHNKTQQNRMRYSKISCRHNRDVEIVRMQQILLTRRSHQKWIKDKDKLFNV